CPARRSGGGRSRSALGCADGAFGHGATGPCWGLRSAFREKPDAPRRRSPHSLLPIEAIAASGLRSFTYPRRRRRRPALAHAPARGLAAPGLACSPGRLLLGSSTFSALHGLPLGEPHIFANVASLCPRVAAGELLVRCSARASKENVSWPSTAR